MSETTTGLVAEARSVLLFGLDGNIGDATRVMQDLADELEAAEAKRSGCCMDDTNVLDASMTQVDEAAMRDSVDDALSNFNGDRIEHLEHGAPNPGTRPEAITRHLIENRAVWLKDGAR